ncbi:MAG: hypothetical protein F6K30_22445 [Cyanothece sp. SIO2G6]|nr:hypothetical protein [Cyanothece sp. SIO2G6]
MTLQELQEQVCQLSVNDRLALMDTIVRSLQDPPTPDWQYLVARPHPWRKQLYIKGKKLLASTVQQDMVVNQMTPGQAAENWELPIAAIQEVMQYCDRHQALIDLEAAEERYRLEAKGVRLEPQPLAR